MFRCLILKNRIRFYRSKFHMRQIDLAKAVGVSKNTISSIETGVFCPTAKLAALICMFFNVRFEDLFYFEFEK